MRFSSPLVSARFLRRLNRFACEVELSGGAAPAHLANSGRLGELLTAGRRVYLAPRPSAHRKTRYDLVLARAGRSLVSLDARLPNALVAEAFEAGLIGELSAYVSYRREVPFDGVRLDFSFTGPAGERCLVEVKSVTLLEGGLALFPDAPTARGARHLEVLSRAVRSRKAEALVLFVVQRPDARAFGPNEAADPRFGDALLSAASRGVKVAAYGCRVSTRGVSLSGPLPVELGRPS